MRFVFCWIIIFYHTGEKLLDELDPPVFDLTFFERGRIGVEFFFLVKGFLFAKSAERGGTGSLSADTFAFMKKKLWGIFPYHIFGFGFTAALYFIINKFPFEEGVTEFFDILPNFFLIQEAGFHTRKIMGIEWYISAMLIAMAVLYPLILKYKDTFKRLVCPILSVLLLGYLCQSTGKLSGTDDYVFGGTVPKTLVRAFSELAFGVFVYEAVKHFQNAVPGKRTRVLLTAAEAAGYLLVVIYSFTSLPKWLDFTAFFALAAAVGITFSGKSCFAGRFNNKLVYFLGKWSLPLYLSQKFAFYFVGEYMGDNRVRTLVILAAIVTVIVSVPVMFLGDSVKRLAVRNS